MCVYESPQGHCARITVSSTHQCRWSWVLVSAQGTERQVPTSVRAFSHLTFPLPPPNSAGYIACESAAACGTYESAGDLVRPVAGAAINFTAEIMNWDTLGMVQWSTLKPLRSGRRLSVLIASADYTVFGRLNAEDFGTPAESDATFPMSFTFPKAGNYSLSIRFKVGQYCGLSRVQWSPWPWHKDLCAHMPTCVTDT